MPKYRIVERRSGLRVVGYTVDRKTLLGWTSEAYYDSLDDARAWLDELEHLAKNGPRVLETRYVDIDPGRAK